MEESKMPRALGVDYGERHIGLAISDELGVLALPLMTLPAQNSGQVIRDILKLCAEKKVGTIVVGLPLNMDGSRGPVAQAVERFVEELRRHTNLAVKVWDERLSSAQVERVLLEADLSRSRRKKLTDKLAAQVILQSYLDAQSQTKNNSANLAGEDSLRGDSSPSTV